MSDPLTLLKASLNSAHLLAGNEETSDFSRATMLSIGEKKFPLDTPTIYILQGAGVSLRECYFAWVHKDLQRTDFLELAESQDVKALGFLQRSDLCDWLQGQKPEFEFSEKVEEEQPQDSVDDSLLNAVLSQERQLVDHNTSLRGSKNVDFSNVAESCKRAFLQASKSDKRHQQQSVSKDKRPQNPIILISPSASAVLTMANIKAFLERGQYISPQTNDPEQQNNLSSADLTMITHTFPKIGKITFMCVDNTDKFSKEEHWDRTIAVFTTGQKWQFKNYKWSSPTELFQKIKGYYFHFEKDPIPQTCNEWNIEKIGLDKHKRFKDAVVLNHFWGSLERAMIAKGWDH
jgi:parafibromin